MELSPYTMQNWQAYMRWYQVRGEAPPPAPPHATFVSHEGQLLCGVCYYLSDPPYMFVENLCTNPEAGASDVHRAVVYLARALMAMGTFENRCVMIMARHKGIIRILQKCGFAYDPCMVFYSIPGAEIKSPPVRDQGSKGDTAHVDADSENVAPTKLKVNRRRR